MSGSRPNTRHGRPSIDTTTRLASTFRRAVPAPLVWAAVGAFAALVGPPPGIVAQVPDSVRADTTETARDTTPDFSIPGLTVSVTRAVTTSGGASALEVQLDSLAHRPAPTLEEVLREMPLVIVRQNSRGQTQPALRGGEDRQIAILMDGVPLTLGWDHRTDLSIVPLTAARNVRLVRGLSSVLHGPNVLGGVVEIDVARGSGSQTAPDPLTASVAVDHLGGRSLALSGGRRFDGEGEWVVRAGAGYHERPGFALPGGIDEEDGQRIAFLRDDDDFRLNSDETRFDAFFSGRYLSPAGAWASLSMSGFTTERGVPPEAHLDDPRLWRYPDQDRFIAAFTAGTGQRGTRWGVGDVEASVGVDLGRTEIDQFESVAFDEIDGGEIGDDLTLTLRLLADHSLGERGELRTALTYADVSHDETLDGSGVNEFRQRLWSLGTEVEWRLGGLLGIPGTSGTRLSAGVAVDGADTPESGDKPPLGTLWEWGGRLGFSTLLTGGDVMLHGSVSRRTRFPALRELYSGALGRFVPNPELRPELLTGGELGATFHGRNTEVQTVLFHQRLTEGIVRSSVVDDEGVRRFKRINRDEVRSTGLELLASTLVGPVTLSGDLTLQDVKGLDDDGAEVELEYEPEVSGRIGVGGHLGWNVRASADLRFVGEQFCENPEIGGLEPFDTDPSTDLSLSRGFRVGRGGALRRIDATLSVNNVTDAAVFDQCGLPQPGRTFRIQLRVR